MFGFIMMGACFIIISLIGLICSLRISSDISRMEEEFDNREYTKQQPIVVKNYKNEYVDIQDSLCLNCEYRERGLCTQHNELYDEDFRIEKIKSCNYWKLKDDEE